MHMARQFELNENRLSINELVMKQNEKWIEKNQASGKVNKNSDKCGDRANSSIHNTTNAVTSNPFICTSFFQKFWYQFFRANRKLNFCHKRLSYRLSRNKSVVRKAKNVNYRKAESTRFPHSKKI